MNEAKTMSTEIEPSITEAIRQLQDTAQDLRGRALHIRDLVTPPTPKPEPLDTIAAPTRPGIPGMLDDLTATLLEAQDLLSQTQGGL